jgi:hypothetical protein
VKLQRLFDVRHGRMTEETAHQGAVVPDHRHARIARAGQLLIPLDRVAAEQRC